MDRSGVGPSSSPAPPAPGPPARSSPPHAAAPRRREASEREQIDGPTATEMLREDWLELGASGIKASKIMAMVASRAQRA